jgi:mannan endo-1,4-beta-mannosidase
MKQLFKTSSPGVHPNRLKKNLLSFISGLMWLGLADSVAQIDIHATPETKNLYANLRKLAPDHLIFGHQNTVVSGIGWTADDPADWQSDVQKAVGDFPGLYGFDFIDGINIRKRQVEEVFRRGGIVTISWHAENPVTGGNYLDLRGNALHAILPGQSHHEIWRKKLDEVAAFFNALEVAGIKVPVIFRPFHENTNGSFWWSDKSAAHADLVAAWQYTVSYLRDTRHVHNLLYAYSPTRPVQLGGLDDDRYPGDAWVDIVGFDLYWGTGDMSKIILENCRAVVQFASAHGKVAAITEAGVGKGISNATINDWFTRCILNPVSGDPVAKNVAYWLTWRNHSATHHWVPRPGEPLYDDFVTFYKDGTTLFQGNLPNVYAPLRLSERVQAENNGMPAQSGNITPVDSGP